MAKKFISAAIAIFVAFILVKIFFAILGLVMQLTYILSVIIITGIFALPLYIIIKKKWLKN